MKKIFITGATGTMGLATLRELKKRGVDYEIVALARHSRHSEKVLAEFAGMKAFRVQWGNLLDYDSLRAGVQDADYVLHMGGMVSPKADYNPQRTLTTNVGGTRLLLKAIIDAGGADSTRFVYIGSIAQSGDNPAPRHWIHARDLLMPSAGDAYALSKTMAEREVVHSGIRNWACLRQTGILSPLIIKKGSDPITFHPPLTDCIEWTTDTDSARLMANICDGIGDDRLWNDFHTIGGGEDYRLTNFEFDSMFLDAMGCPPPERVFDTKWFATRNFHSGWWADSDRLEEIMHYRSGETMEEYFESMKKSLPAYFRLARIVPALLIKWGMKQVAKKAPFGTLYWFSHGNEEKIAMHFGSREEAEKIPGWEMVEEENRRLYPPQGSRQVPEGAGNDTGWDDDKPREEITLADLRKRAEFLGGELLDVDFVKGRLDTVLNWRCREGHSFRANAASVMLGGHWCPECLVKHSRIALPEGLYKE